MAIYYTVNQMAQELEHEDESRYKPEPKVDRKVTPTKVRVGGVHVSIWKNEDETGKARHSISIQRVYRTAQGNWKNTQYLRLNDIPKLILALQHAYEEITLEGTRQIIENE